LIIWPAVGSIQKEVGLIVNVVALPGMANVSPRAAAEKTQSRANTGNQIELEGIAQFRIDAISISAQQIRTSSIAERLRDRIVQVKCPSLSGPRTTVR
jgi:hypothetical protein